MKAQTVLGGFALGLAMLEPGKAVAQSPIGPEFVATGGSGHGTQYSLVFLPQGSLAVVWATGQELVPDEVEVHSEGRLIGPEGSPGPIWRLENDVRLPLLVQGAQSSQEFRVLSLWSDRVFQPTAYQFRSTRFSSHDGSALAPPIDLGIEYRPSLILAAASSPSGTTLVDWLEYDANNLVVATARLLGASDELLDPPFRLLPEADGETSSQSIAVREDNSFWVTGEFDAGLGTSYDIYVRQVTGEGALLPLLPRVNTYTAGFQTKAKIGRAGDGSFVIVWESELQDGDYEGIYGQRFAPDGSKVGPEFLINVTSRSAQRDPDLAMDPHGNFVVVWASFDPFSAGGAGDWNLFARLFRKDGTPVAGEIPVARSRMLEELPRVAFGPLGVFAVAWQSYLYDPEFGDVAARRFLASEGAEPCLVNEGKLRCDAGHTAGTPELERGMMGLAKATTALLGDLDGDGRDDLCARSGTRFLCDLNHQGHRAELDLAFGLLSDTPLLGDLDGDGRDDPCVRRGNRILCDTAHNGGNHELALRFGFGGDQALIGDIDGDGRDEACVFRSGRFLCDTGHNGGSAELVVSFGLPGDTALLGDFDGDGRDDPCVFRLGHFVCDTAHDGGAAEIDLFLDGAGQPLLGNLDGL